MTIKLHFLGAARNVTGSCYLLETDKAKVLIDCGLYQEREFRDRNYAKFAVNPSKVDAVILTHAHLDHCGLIPKLIRDGFNGKLFCTPATAEIAPIVMSDSAHLMAEDLKFKKKRHKRENRKSSFPYKLLYEEKDVERTKKLIHKTGYNREVKIAKGVTATFHNAGHILGSSMVRLTVENDGDPRSILFSGDVGRWDRPILKDPNIPDGADYVVTESTYGDRIHEDDGDIPEILCNLINETSRKGGNILIPSFAIERSQEVLYIINGLVREKRIPRIMVFLDSPMAVSVTEIFRKHPELFDEEMKDLMDSGFSPFNFDGLKLCRTKEESKAINQIRGTTIIIAGSGMCTGGRIKHHLTHNIHRPESAILFVGYQASGTLGRELVEGNKEVRIFRDTYTVNARVEQVHGFSGHADRNELLRFLKSLKKSPKKVFVTHGGANVSTKFAKDITEETSWEAFAPEYRQKVILD